MRQMKNVHATAKVNNTFCCGGKVISGHDIDRRMRESGNVLPYSPYMHEQLEFCHTHAFYYGYTSFAADFDMCCRSTISMHQQAIDKKNTRIRGYFGTHFTTTSTIADEPQQHSGDKHFCALLKIGMCTHVPSSTNLSLQCFECAFNDNKTLL